jgi:Asp-tRNA(Asn)/Glu-tRNA(Gln) amidotransferase A subunit family amidase
MSGYDLRSLKLPKLTGPALQLFAAALDYPLTRGLILPGLQKQGGVDKLRAVHLEGDPTLYPFAPAEKPADASLTPAQVEVALDPAPQPGPFATARDYAAAYRRGTVTPVEVAGRILAGIAESDQGPLPLRAFIANDREDVMAQARASAERIRAGRPLSILDGVPVAVKDELDQAPYPTHAGTSFFGVAPARDSTVVARLRLAGALLIGKATMNELGLDPCGFNARFGTTRNPYNLEHDPGGSSSGPAAAVAAGFCPVSLGCDGGGSIRIPSSLCGLVGLKPTFGRVSEVGAAPLCPSVDVIGPIGATVEDVAIVYGLIAGPDPLDPRSRFQPPVDLEGWHDPDLHGLTFGKYTPWFEHAAPAVVAACEAMLEKLVRAGANVREIEIPALDAMRIAHVASILCEQAANLQDRREHLRELSAPTRVTLALSHAFSAADYVQAQRIRTQAIAAFERAFGEVDAILTPATAITAPPIPAGGTKAGWSDLSVTTEKMRYAYQANLTGHPAISFPVGYDGNGLPIGMQAIGHYWGERTLLRIARAAERLVDRRRPGVFFSILDREDGSMFQPA